MLFEVVKIKNEDEKECDYCYIFWFIRCRRFESLEKKKPEEKSSGLCGRGDSNPHAVRHQILSLACLPVSTRPLYWSIVLLIQKERFQILIPIAIGMACLPVSTRPHETWAKIGKSFNDQTKFLMVPATIVGFSTGR